MAEDIIDIADGVYGDPAPKLKDQDRSKLDSIVSAMIKNKESDDAINLVVEDFKRRYAAMPEPSVGKVDFSKFMLQGIPADQPFTSVTEERNKQIKKAEERALKAQEEVRAALSNNPDVVEKMIRRGRMERSAAQTPIPISDMPKTGSDITVERMIAPAIQPKDDIVTADEINRVTEYNKNNEGGARGFVSEITRLKPDQKKKLEQAIYDVDALNSLKDQSEIDTRLPKILRNSEELAKGKLEYDVKSGRLYRPEGLVKSFLTGWRNKTKSFEDYDFLKGTENDSAVIMQLDADRANQDVDEPVPVPKGITAEMGQMVGGTPAKALAAGAIASALGTPKAGVIAGSIVGGREMAKLEYANTFKSAYYDLVDQGIDKFEAVRKARSLAEQSAEIGAVVGGASGLIGGQWGIRPLPKVALTGGVKKAVSTLLKKEGTEFSKPLLEGLAAGGIGAAGEGYKNALAQSAGINRDITQGMAEQIEQNLIFGAALGVMAKAGKGVNPKSYRTLANALKKVDDNVIDGALTEMVDSGQLTAPEVETAKKEISQYKEIDSRIPDNVSEDARITIQDKIKKRDQFESQLETTDKAFHPEIKEKIKVIEEEINGLAKDRIKKTPQEKGIEKVINNALEENRIPGVFAEMAKNDPEAFLKFVADQALGRDESGVVMPGTEADIEVRRNFGDEIVDKAIEVFPIDKPKESIISVIRPEENKPVTDITTIGPKTGNKLLVDENTDFFNDVKELYGTDGVKYIVRNPKNESGDYIIQRRDGNNEVITIPQEELVKRVNDGDLLLNKPIKIESDAISIESPEEIPVHETSRDSGEMGKRISESEEFTREEGQREKDQVASEEIIPPEITAAASSIHVQRPETELSFRGLQNIANEFSLTDVEGRPRKTDIQLRKDAEIDINNWRKEGTYNEKIEGITRKAEDGDVLTDKQRVIMEQHLANAVEGYRQMPDKTSPEAKELFGYVKRLKDAGEKTRSEAGAALRIPTFRSRPDASIEDFMLRQAEISKVGELTDQQIRTNEKEFNEISAAEKAYQDKIDQLEAENAKLKLEQDVKKKAATKGPKRTKEEYAKERKDILGSIKKKLDESKGQLSSTVVPYADVLFKIAPDVAKLVKNLVEEGIDNLPALVKAVHTELKQFIDPITEKDAQDLIGGVYDKKKRTRTELTARLRDLKDEAKYLSKYQELKSGVEPKSENQKIKRNQQIEQLKKNIKEHDLTKIASAKSRINKEITELQEKLAAKDYSIPEKSEIKLDKEAIELKDELIKLRKEREIRLAEEEYANRTKFQKTIDYASIPARELRTIWSSFDLSMPARQGLIPTAAELLTNPKKTAQRSKGMLQAAGSEKFFDRYMHDLKSDPTYKMMEESGVAISDPNNINSKEEVFQSKYVQKIPGIGTYGIKGSERAAAYWLNSQRKDLFLRGVDLMEQNGRTFENSPEVYKKWASVVNTLTGRGELVGSAKNASEFLSTFLFSPKLMASRLALFNPAFYAKIPKEIRMMYIKDFAKFLALGTGILATAKMFGAETEPDPRNSDFGKIKLGNTRWDIWGGLQQYVRLFAQLGSMTKVGKGGKETDLWEPGRSGERPLTGVLQTFLRSKSSPVIGTLWDIAAGENIVGEEVTLQSELWKLAPIMVRDMIDAAKEEGVGGVAKNIPAIIGVGVQTYDTNKPKTGKSKKSKQQQNKKTKNE